MKRPRPSSALAPIESVTSKQVAAVARGTGTTVSRVLGQRDTPGGKIQCLGLRTVRGFQKQVNRLAPGLRRASLRKAVGMLDRDLQNPFLSNVMHGRESVLYVANYSLKGK